MAVPSNIFDPFASFRPADPRLQPPIEAALPPPVEPLPPPPPAPEEPGIASQLGHAALSGLGIVGNALDLFPSMLRDIATLDNPLDQLLTPFSDENRNTGRDVLTKWGVTKENDPDKWELADLAGFGVDVISGIPMGGLSLGAKAGPVAAQIARRAGMYDDLARIAPKVGPREAAMTHNLGDLLKPLPGEVVPTVKGSGLSLERATKAKAVADEMDVNLEDVLNEPLGGLVGVGMPFGPVKKVYGTGERAQQVARALDTAGATLKKTAPVRLARSLFDYRTMGKGADPMASAGANVVAQQIAEQATAAKPAAMQAARTTAAEMSDKLDEVQKVFDRDFGDVMDLAGGESVGQFAAGDVVHAADRNNYGRIIGRGKKGASVEFVSPETGATAIVDLPLDQISKVSGVVADDVARRATQSVFNRVVRFATERGGDVDEALDRFVNEGTKASDELSSAMRAVGDDMQAANRAVNQAILDKGGTTNFLDESGLFEGGFEHFPRYMNPKQQASIDRAGGRRIMPTKHAGMKARNPAIERIPTDVVNQLATDPAARGEDAAEYIANAYRKFLDPNYDGDYVGDFTKQAEDIAAWVKDRPQKELLTQGVLDDFTKYQIGGQTTSRFLDAIHATVARTMGSEGVPLAGAFKRAGMAPDKAIAHLAAMTGESVEALAKRKIPTDVADGIMAVLKPVSSPEYGQAIANLTDSLLNKFKTWVTLPFPAFHARNLTSGQVVNLVSGDVGTAKDLATYGKTFTETLSMLKKGVDPELSRELRIHDVLKDTGFLDVGIVRSGSGKTPGNPFKIKDTWRESAEAVADVSSPASRIPGANRVRQAADAATRTGSKAMESVEFMNRVTMYRYLRKKGYTPAKAAERVSEVQFDYSRVTPFERGVMKRVLPFYSFSRFSMPLVLGTLYAQPGGPLAQMIRLTSQGTPDEPVPDYIASGTSIPLGTRESGDRSFLTGLGLSHEDALQYLGGGVRGAGMEILSRANPLIKAPLEWATGQSFFQHGADGGRALEDLDPPIGRTLANIAGDDEAYDFPGRPIEFLASATPLSRFITSARTLTDRRKTILDKAFNLGTGLRISDVSPASADKEMRNRAFSLMKDLGARSFRDIYFSKDQLAEMAPEQRAAADELRGLVKTLDVRAKQRKAAKLLATGSAD